jgi:hypothetical protein
MAYLGVLLVSVAAQPLGCLTVLDEKWIYVAAWVETVRGGREDEMQGRRRADGDMWP